MLLYREESSQYFYYFQDFPGLFLCIEDQLCGGVTASQWHQPSKGQSNEEKNEAHCSQQEDFFFFYLYDQNN